MSAPDFIFPFPYSHCLFLLLFLPVEEQLLKAPKQKTKSFSCKHLHFISWNSRASQYLAYNSIFQRFKEHELLGFVICYWLPHDGYSKVIQLGWTLSGGRKSSKMESSLHLNVSQELRFPFFQRLMSLVAFWLSKNGTRLLQSVILFPKTLRIMNTD